MVATRSHQQVAIKLIQAIVTASSYVSVLDGQQCEQVDGTAGRAARLFRRGLPKRSRMPARRHTHGSLDRQGTLGGTGLGFGGEGNMVACASWVHSYCEKLWVSSEVAWQS